MKAIPPPAADARLDDQEGRDCGGHRSRDAARTRQRLLHTAARLFAANGYAATTVREIAHEADVNAALINRYFASKEGLFEACLTAGSHRIRPFADDGDEDDIAYDLDTLAPMLARELVGVGIEPLLLLLRSSGDDRAERIRRDILQNLGERTAALAGWQAGGDDGLLLHAQLLVSLAIGIAVLRSRSGGPEPLASATAAELAAPLNDVVDALLRRR